MKSLLQYQKRGFSFTYPCPRKLREIVKISLFEKETPEVISEIWDDYHNTKAHAISKVIPQSLYLRLLSNGQTSPMFIFPVPKDAGYFMLLSQNQQKSFIFTYLEDFKKNPLTANPYLVLTCFDELVRTKGVALIRGDVIGQLNKNEAKTVLEKLLNSYLIDSQFETIKQFNHQPQQFNYENYTQESLQDFRRIYDEVKNTIPKQKDVGVHRKQTWYL
ncbi:atp11 protein [Stylonychia lemnae]|uniref:Atp11 protein n=1 Tax=Stylonychia lemnae TaxID=5949 RepID=A0A078B7S6_STYLE|nr:atp11 protein [Stylonychia lemnae]|eukprot:CDW90570.1 atp11 protein [Stylonychia lemnae]